MISIGKLVRKNDGPEEVEQILATMTKLLLLILLLILYIFILILVYTHLRVLSFTKKPNNLEKEQESNRIYPLVDKAYYVDTITSKIDRSTECLNDD